MSALLRAAGQSFRLASRGPFLAAGNPGPVPSGLPSGARSITNCIFVNNLDPSTSVGTFREHCESFGRVLELDYFVTTGVGTVTTSGPQSERGNARVVFANHHSAIAAVDEMHNTYYQGKRVYVNFTRCVLVMLMVVLIWSFGCL